MIIVGKATQDFNNPDLDYVEVMLPAYRPVLTRTGKFAYAWTFNPDDEALAALRQNRDTWLYLIGEPYLSPMKMRIVDVEHSREPLSCPNKWRQHCVREEWGITSFSDQPNWPPIHLWLLVDRIERVEPQLDVRKLSPYFRRKYHMYGQSYFGFFR